MLNNILPGGIIFDDAFANDTEYSVTDIRYTLRIVPENSYYGGSKSAQYFTTKIYSNPIEIGPQFYANSTRFFFSYNFGRTKM